MDEQRRLDQVMYEERRRADQERHQERFEDWMEEHHRYMQRIDLLFRAKMFASIGTLEEAATSGV